MAVTTPSPTVDVGSQITLVALPVLAAAIIVPALARHARS